MLIGLYQFALTVGIALADLVGYWLANQQAWRLMFGIGAIPAIVFFFMVLVLPESPRWLFSQNRASDAKAVLNSYTDESGAQLLLEDIRTGLAAQVETRWSALWSPAVRGSLVIAVGFTILQQVTGIDEDEGAGVAGPQSLERRCSARQPARRGSIANTDGG